VKANLVENARQRYLELAADLQVDLDQLKLTTASVNAAYADYQAALEAISQPEVCDRPDEPENLAQS
jgi:hypothetical protein